MLDLGRKVDKLIIIIINSLLRSDKPLIPLHNEI